LIVAARAAEDKACQQSNVRPIILHRGRATEGEGVVFVGATTDKPDASRIDADDAVRGRPYYCPACHAPVDYKVGEHVVAHFAHKAGASDCLKSKGDMRRHMEMERQMRTFFERRYRALVDYEVPFMKGAEGRYAHYADLVVKLPNGFTFVCECQHSSIIEAEWERRTRDYSEARDYGQDGWPVLWVWDSTRLCTDAAGGDNFVSELWADGEHEVTVPAEVLRCHKVGYRQVYGLDIHERFRVIHYEPVKRHNAYMGWDTTLERTKTLLVRDFDWWRPAMSEDKESGLKLVSMGGAKGAWWRTGKMRTPATTAQAAVLAPTPLPLESPPTPTPRPTPVSKPTAAPQAPPAPQLKPVPTYIPTPATPVYANHSRQVRRPSRVPGLLVAIIALTLIIVVILSLTGQLHLRL